MRTQRRVMFEWVMIDGTNDSQEQANSLASRLSGLPCHVNLIRLNPTDHYDGQAATDEAIESFAAVLDRSAIPHTMRQNRGRAIHAGCGQLRRRTITRQAQTDRSVVAEG